MSFIVGHAVWSIAVPIAVVELMVPERAHRPWLGRTGLAVVAAALVVHALLGPVTTLLATPEDPARWAGNAVFAGPAVGLVVLARRRVRAAADAPRTAPASGEPVSGG
jgi:hypothetical protein